MSTTPMSKVPSSSHPKPSIDWFWIGFVIIETIVNVGLLRFRWFSLSWAQMGWAFAEMVRFFSTLFKAFQLLMPIKRAPINLDKLLERKDFPTVDIMIPCYNEPLEVRPSSYLIAISWGPPSHLPTNNRPAALIVVAGFSSVWLSDCGGDHTSCLGPGLSSREGQGVCPGRWQIRR